MVREGVEGPTAWDSAFREVSEAKKSTSAVADSGCSQHHSYVGVLTREEVYAKYADELVRFATTLAGPDDGADLVASAMVKVLWSPSWDGVRNERAYLYRAVLNEAHRNYRRNMTRAAAEARAAVPDRGGPFTPNLHPEVMQALGRLSMRQRAVLFLAYWEDLRPVDIARRLGLSEGTVHRHLSRGTRQMRRHLDGS